MERETTESLYAFKTSKQKTPLNTQFNILKDGPSMIRDWINVQTEIGSTSKLNSKQKVCDFSDSSPATFGQCPKIGSFFKASLSK